MIKKVPENSKQLKFHYIFPQRSQRFLLIFRAHRKVYIVYCASRIHLPRLSHRYKDRSLFLNVSKLSVKSQVFSNYFSTDLQVFSDCFSTAYPISILKCSPLQCFSRSNEKSQQTEPEPDLRPEVKQRFFWGDRVAPDY